MHIKLKPILIGPICCFILFFISCFYSTAQAESQVYTDTIPFKPMRWTDSMTFPQFDPTLGILTRAEITLTGGITGSTSYTNQVNAITQVSIDIPANLRLQSPNNTLLNAGGTIFSFTENVGPFASGARAPLPVLWRIVPPTSIRLICCRLSASVRSQLL